jgi:UDP-glucose 4-epimerase
MATKLAVVTGAAGFIGSHMVDLLLERGYRVHGIDNLSHGRLSNLEQHRNESRFVFENRDVRELRTDDTLFRRADCVIHFAGIGDIVPSIDKPVDYMSVNVMGTVRCLEAARHAGVGKFVYAASSSCYGAITPVPTTESAPICPEYPYALSKYMGEEAVFHWAKVYHLPVNSIRIFNAFGLRSRTSGAYGAVFGVFLAQKLAHKPLTVVGDGTQRRDFVYVTDVARSFLAAAETPRAGEVYNVGTGGPQSVNRLVELIGGPIVRLPKRPGEPDVTWADISKIRTQLGWEPIVDFADAVVMMLKHIDLWRDAPVWDPASIQEATRTWFAMLEQRKSA